MNCEKCGGPMGVLEHICLPYFYVYCLDCDETEYDARQIWCYDEESAAARFVGDIDRDEHYQFAMEEDVVRVCVNGVEYFVHCSMEPHYWSSTTK